MGEDVGLEMTDEEQRERARVAFADDAGVHRAAEVIGGNAQAAARRRLFLLGVEGNDQRRGMHVHGDGRADDGGHERNELLGEPAQDDLRIGRRVDAGQLLDELGDGERARAHRRREQLPLGRAVAEDRRRRDLQRAGDIGERGRREAAVGERSPGGVEDLIAGDARRAAHL